MSFPEDFAWGASSSSYQVEGGAYSDGKGLGVWDVFCKRPGMILNDDTGDVSADHYHRWAEDVELMKQMNLKAYRFSTSWPRVLPEGTGKVNQAGLDFYSKLVDGLLAAGIEPYLTLFHWDYPFELYCRGGWLNNESPDWFAEYTGVMVDKLSDRVKYWITMNEANVVIGQGHSQGISAPGIQLSTPEIVKVLRNMLLAHGKGMQVIRANAKQPVQAGSAPGMGVGIPVTDSPEDIAAAKEYMFDTSSPANGCGTPWWYDPALLGTWPESAREFELPGSEMTDDDLKTINQPADFVGMNCYFGRHVQRGENGKVEVLPRDMGYDCTMKGWVIMPEVLDWGVKFAYDRYKLPIIVTENGMANADIVSADGKVHDPQRIEYLRRYLSSLGKAIDDGIPVKGYMQWTILDNFEWRFGYRERFGLVYVDYKDGSRIVKESAKWYAKVIETNGASLND